MTELHPTLQMSRTCLVDDSHAVARDRVAAALEIVRRPAGPPRPFPRGVPERNPRAHRPERRRQDDDAEDPRRVVAAGLRDRARARPRRAGGSGRLQGGARLHAGGPDPPRVPDADRVPRLRRPDPESPERADRRADVRTPEGPRPRAEGRRDDRLVVERDEGEGRVRGRNHSRALDPRPRRAAHRHRSRGTTSAERPPGDDGPRRRHGPRLDPPTRHGGASLPPRGNREPRAERGDWRPRGPPRPGANRGRGEPRRYLPALDAGSRGAGRRNPP